MHPDPSTAYILATSRAAQFQAEAANERLARTARSTESARSRWSLPAARPWRAVRRLAALVAAALTA